MTFKFHQQLLLFKPSTSTFFLNLRRGQQVYVFQIIYMLSDARGKYIFNIFIAYSFKTDISES